MSRAFENTQASLSVWEAEHLVRDLVPFTIMDIGSEEWMKQHENLEKLNIQAHQNALSKHDEYVYEAFISFNQVPLLIHDLLITETWREKIFPILLKDGLVDEHMSVKVYMVLFHEAVLLNLLEVLLFHRAAVLSLDGDALAELIDYAYRVVTAIHNGLLQDDYHLKRGLIPKADAGPSHADALHKSDATLSAFASPGSPLTQYLHHPGVAEAVARARAGLSEASETPSTRLARQSTDIMRGVSTCVVSIVRFITDAVAHLSHTTLYRIVNKHDFALALIPLICDSPWTRRRQQHPSLGEVLAAAQKDEPVPASSWVTEKYLDQRWVAVAADEVVQLSKTEAQLWLSVYNLLLDAQLREIYEWSRQRADAVATLTRHFTEPLLDQLPLLSDLRRLCLEAGVAGRKQEGARAVAIVETVPLLRVTALKQVREWARQRRKAHAQSKAGKRADGAAVGTSTGALIGGGDGDGDGAVRLGARLQLLYDGDEAEEEEEDVEEMWRTLALYHAQSHFSHEHTNALLAHLRRTAATYTEHALDLVAPPVCVVCGAEAVNRCGGCKSEWYCGRTCQVRAWKEHKPVCETIKKQLLAQQQEQEQAQRAE